MADTTILVIATRNPGKTAEIREMLKEYPLRIGNIEDFGPIPEVEEDGRTFEENAYKKASFTARVLGLPALADDSGLVVETLGGAPGVHSARFAGDDATDAERDCPAEGHNPPLGAVLRHQRATGCSVDLL